MTQLIDEPATHSPTAPRTSPAPASCRSVLFIIDQLTELGGAERMMFELANQLSARGYRTTVVTFREGPSPEAYSYAPNIVVLPLRSCFSWRALTVARQLRKLIRERKIELVQTYFESADLFGAIVCWLSGVRNICSSRRDMGLLRKKRHALLYRLCAPFYSRIFAVSRRVAEWHRRQDRIAPEKIDVIYNGVPLEAYDRHTRKEEVRLKLGLPAHAPLVTTVANINRWKGLDVFLEAAAIIHRRRPAAIFAVAGDITDRVHYGELVTRARALGLLSNIFFLGHVDDVPSLLRSSDIFALLSRTEGFPNVVIEAMAAKIPVVATDVGGTSEAVADGVTGYIVPSGDYETAASRIHALLSEPALRKRLTQSARSLVEQQFSLGSMVHRHMEVYDVLASS